MAAGGAVCTGTVGPGLACGIADALMEGAAAAGGATTAAGGAAATDGGADGVGRGGADTGGTV